MDAVENRMVASLAVAARYYHRNWEIGVMAGKAIWLLQAFESEVDVSVGWGSLLAWK